MDGRCIIVGAGDFYGFHSMPAPGDYLIAADAGYRWCMQQQVIPDLVVGDFDSLKNAPDHPNIIRLPVEKDDTDTLAAIRLGLEKGYRQFELYGVTGGREDHTIGNLGLLMEYTRMFDLGDIRIEAVSDHSTAFPLTDSCELHVGKGRRVSLFSPDNSLTIKSEGLQWPTDAVVFDNWWPATLNRATEDVVKLAFSHPSRVLAILD